MSNDHAENPPAGGLRRLGGGNPVYGSMAVTSNGVLALVRQGGALEAADLTTGTLLWSRAYSHQEYSDGPAASGPVVVAAVKGTVSGFDAITGRLLWRRGGMPSTVDVIAGPGGRVLSYDILQQVTPAAKDLFPVTALSAATGQVLWRLPTAGPVAMISAQQGCITVGTSGTYRLYLVNPATGRARLSVAAYVANDMTWVLTPTDLVYLSEYQPPESAAGATEVVDRRLATGAVRWSVRLLDGSDGAVVRPSGPDVLVTENTGGRPAVLAIDLATGHPRPATALPQITVASPVVSGGSALLALGSPPCAVPGPAASRTTPALNTG